MDIALSFLAFVALNVVVGWTALKILSLLKRGALVWFVLYIGEILLIQVVLGAFGILNFAAVSVFAVLIALSVGWKWGWRIHRAKNPPWLGLGWSSHWMLVVLAPLVVLFILRLFFALLELPFEYDSGAYHLPMVVEWLRTGSLWNVYYSAFAGPVGFYPGNGELLTLWLYLPFHSDLFANLLNFFLYPWLFIALYQLGRTLGFARNVAIGIAALFMYMPQSLQQLGTPQVDIFFTLTFVLVLYFGIQYFKKMELVDLFLCGLSVGFCVGTKYLGLPYLALPLLVLAGFILYKKRKWPVKVLAHYGAGIGALLMGGGFWFVRNMVITGNPLFPLEVKVGGVTLLQGYGDLTAHLATTSVKYALSSVAVAKEVVGALWQVTGVSGILFLTGGALAFLYTVKSWRVSLILIASFLYGFFVYVSSPFTYENLLANMRYAMPLFIVGLLPWGYVVGRNWLMKSFFYVVVMGAVTANLLFFMIDAFPGQGSLYVQYGMKFLSQWSVYFMLCVAAMCGLFLLKYWKKAIAVYALLFFMVSGLWLNQMNEVRNREWFSIAQEIFNLSVYKHPVVFNALTITDKLEKLPDAKHVAFTGLNYHYHFLGRDLSREVNYININECTYCRYQDYRTSPQSVRRDPSFESWYANLQTRSINYVVVAPNFMPSVRNYEFEWMNEHPEKFQKVFDTTNGEEQFQHYLFKVL
ncbi:glycosyltransferase family 39 protein [Candidatus Gracilibacteria bacterium]|nr:glycosyltransferase family 39 protein [Candidatus Gracilibacteria bacterium]